MKPPGQGGFFIGKANFRCETWMPCSVSGYAVSVRISDCPSRVALVRIVIDLCRLPYEDQHFNAVQLICSSALEHFRGIERLCLDENPIPAKALSRILLENLVTAVVLAKHPEKLQDFRDCGRYLHLRSMRSTGIAELNDRKSALLKKHGTDYSQLEKRFRYKLWHGMTRREALNDAGYIFERDPDMYDEFFRPTSDFVHSDPSRFLMRDLNDEWILGRSDKKEAVYLLGAYMSSTSLLLTGMEQINRVLGLQFGDRLAAFKSTLFEFIPKYKAAVFKLANAPARERRRR